MKKILNVYGMTCDHCVSTIKEAVEKLVGILDVEVEIEKNLVVIEMDENKAKIEVLVEKIIEAGFKVKM
jgi:copper chaperone CopZ